jgi:glycosyltransferase involved in cell wall biosynthesis
MEDGELSTMTDIERDRPIIVMGTNRWGDDWQTRQQITSRLGGRGWQVAYSTGTLFAWDRFTDDWRDCGWFESSTRKYDVEVHMPGRWQLRWPRVPAWDRFVVRRYLSDLKKRVGWSAERRPLVYVFHPVFWPYVEVLGDCSVVYHADDTFSSMPGWTEEQARMQEKLVARADLIVASSPGMAEALPNDGPARTRQLPNGADTPAFINAAGCECPDDLAAIPHPRIGYVGKINEKVNLALVLSIARQKPDWQWVFIGLVHEEHLTPETAAIYGACKALPNVHFLGFKPYHGLPAYNTHMDVNVMCYRSEQGGWWTDLYPLKLHEYLATGKPVVGADIRIIKQFSEVVAVAGSEAEWLSALEDAIENGGVSTPGERQRVAAENSWGGRVDQLESWLNELG